MANFHRGLSVIPEIKQQFRANGVVIYNALWLLTDKVAKAGFMLAISALLGRYFGPEPYGQIAYALAFVTIFQGVATLGLDAVTVRDLSTDRANAHQTVGTIFGLRLMFGAILWPMAIALAYLIGPDDRTGLILISLIGLVLIVQASDTIDLWFQSQNLNKITTLIKLCVYLFGIASRLYLIAMDTPVWAFAAMVAIDAVLAGSFMAVFYRKYPTEMPWQFSANRAARALKEGWPFLLGAVSVLLYARIDQIFIKNFSGEYALGIYAIAATISGFFAIIPVSVSSAAAPYFANLKIASEQNYIKHLKILNIVAFILSVTICILVFYTSEFVIVNIYGDAFFESATILQIHIFSCIPLFLGVAQNIWIVNERLGKTILYKTLSGLAVSILGNFYFIPLYGAVGAAYVAIATQFTTGVLANFIFDRRYVKIQFGSIKMIAGFFNFVGR